MQLIAYNDANSTMMGRAIDDDRVQPIATLEEFWADPYRWSDGADGPSLDLGTVEQVPPVPPSAKVVCVGLNYAEHAAEGDWEPPRYPTVFGRWTSSLAVDGGTVAVPPDEPGLDWEAELAAVIGRPLYRADNVDVADVVYGYAAFNDLTARHTQKLTSQWTLGKNADGSGPIGSIVTASSLGPIDDGLRIEALVNGEVEQSDSTASMIFDLPYLLRFISKTMTLNPGDVIATGTPSGVGYVRTPPRFLTPGDRVEIRIERVGSVTTSVVAG